MKRLRVTLVYEYDADPRNYSAEIQTDALRTALLDFDTEPAIVLYADSEITAAEFTNESDDRQEQT